MLRLVSKLAHCKTCVQVQLHSNRTSTRKMALFPKNLASWLFWCSIDAIQVEMDWTGDNSCPYEVRSKYFVVVNDILYTNKNKIQYLSKIKKKKEKWTHCSIIVPESVSDCYFRILPQRVTFETWDPSDIWSGWWVEKKS